mmetsp:Transcript_49336/g.124051  ORF Transcript_49336/g.124051 Transcript_49336/m.124051 type:complete len:371 (-) Transcript_49336:82-1194(-)|eukprot:CAMPEP_0177636704 /NCGR_PEP_ID=MMETSP0447-20121125/4578_1 /TAXON_ID=0 /ORGANISM="Stygamoeba regulata, Strain BSH-02190019" /LENGTH=370 /DNA_ID=CAMNT_0019138579 /DNA_START=37 /DNA_END=1149 /DNA_ORIENTATION=+
MADSRTSTRPVAFVINPVSGAGAGLSTWKKIRPLVEHRFGTARAHCAPSSSPSSPVSSESTPNQVATPQSVVGFVELLTAAQGDAWRLTREAVENGCSAVVCLGGDGTVNEVVNGYMEGDGHERGVRFALLPCGTGGDLARTLYPDNSISHTEILDLIAAGVAVECDLGSVRCTTLVDGSPTGSTVRYWLNMSGVGIGGAVCHAVNHSSVKWLGGRIAFLYHTIATTLRWKNRRLRYRLDESPDWIEATVYMLVAGNGRYQGGGMKPVPQANMRNGLLDVVVIEDFGLLDLPQLHRIYDGSHLDSPDRVYRHQCARLLVEPLDPADRVYLETDGETPGLLPAEWRIHPRQIRVVAPASFLEQHPASATQS